MDDILARPALSTGAPRDTSADSDLASYDTVIVACSGGKDSIACPLTLPDAGVPRSHVHRIDS